MEWSAKGLRDRVNESSKLSWLDAMVVWFCYVYLARLPQTSEGSERGIISRMTAKFITGLKYYFVLRASYRTYFCNNAALHNFYYGMT